jgi:predicted nucleic acid-binding protein
MRPIVIDTSRLLPAFLSAGAKPRSRSLVILTALGGLTLRQRTIEAEVRSLRQEGGRPGAEVHDEPLLQRVEAVARRRDEFRDRLGMRAPDDLCLVGSRLLFDELERKVREVGQKFDPRLPNDAPALVRRQIERLRAYVVEFEPAERMPAWTTDPDDDHIVETAFRAKARIVSRDAHLVPGGESRFDWQDPARGVTGSAYWLASFVEEQVNNSGFGIDDVDPALLELAVSPLV